MTRKKADPRFIAHYRSRQAVRQVLSQLKAFRRGARKSLHEMLDRGIAKLERAIQADLHQRDRTAESRLDDAIDLIETVASCYYDNRGVRQRLEVLKQQLEDSLKLRGLLKEGSIEGVALAGVTPGELKTARTVVRRAKARASKLQLELHGLKYEIAEATRRADDMQWFLQQTAPK